MAHWYSVRIEEGWTAVRALNDAIDPDFDPFAAAFAATTAAVDACYADPAAADHFAERVRGIAAMLRNPALDIMLHWASGIIERFASRFDAALSQLPAGRCSAERRADQRVRQP